MGNQDANTLLRTRCNTQQGTSNTDIARPLTNELAAQTGGGAANDKTTALREIKIAAGMENR